MQSDKALFIIAAGLSTRFNGEPKHLAKVKGQTILEHTVELARDYYGKIYVVLNEKANRKSIASTTSIAIGKNAEVVLIPSGKGDADAVYQALEKTHFNEKEASICWGDAWFVDSSIFKEASFGLSAHNNVDYVFNAMCAYEDTPYGWFNLDGYKITRCTFASDVGGPIECGVHDQCFFNINVKNFKNLYSKYIKSIEAKVHALEDLTVLDSKAFKIKVSYEVSWYKMINWALSIYNDPLDYSCSIATMLSKPVAMSFNTVEDLEKIENA